MQLRSRKVAGSPIEGDSAGLGEWVDGRTEWFTVKVFRNAAITVANSVKKGQPVTVHGRFRTSEWEGEGGTRVDLVIDATSVGHDLTRGTAEFTRAFGDAGLSDAAPSGDSGAGDPGAGDEEGDETAPSEAADASGEAESVEAESLAAA